MSRRPDPLTPGERDLAAHLSRIGPHGEPPAALDARILSAAHAALPAESPSPRRWPAVLGVAATLALALGITWQLRPHDEAPRALGEAPAATSTSVEAPAPAAPSKPLVTPPLEAAPPRALPPAQTAAAKPALPPGPPAKPAGAGRRAAARATSLPVEESATRIEGIDATGAAEHPAFAPRTTTAPAAPPAPPPPPAPAPPPVQANEAIPMPAMATPPAAIVHKAMPQATGARAIAATEEARAAAGHRRSDIAVDDDARLEPADWLARIRQRLAAGDLAGARASLALFRRHHPDQAIPEDIAPLAQ